MGAYPYHPAKQTRGAVAAVVVYVAAVVHEQRINDGFPFHPAHAPKHTRISLQLPSTTIPCPTRPQAAPPPHTPRYTVTPAAQTPIFHSPPHTDRQTLQHWSQTTP